MLRRIFAIGTLAALVAVAAGCSSGERFVYTPEVTAYTSFDIGAQPREAVLQRCLDNLAASDILDPNIVPELRNPNYAFRDENGDWGGRFSRWNNRIDFLFDDFGESVDEQLHKNDLCEMAVHEFAHYFYENKLTQEDRDAFRATILWLKGAYDEIQMQEGIGIEDFGFTPESFQNFEDFLALEDDYRKKYGLWFDECFYGTEAFAYLVQPEVMLKLAYVGILSIDYSEEPTLPRESIRYQGMRREQEITREKLGEITYIPPHLLEFYRGFLHPRYFSTEFNPAESDSTGSVLSL